MLDNLSYQLFLREWRSWYELFSLALDLKIRCRVFSKSLLAKVGVYSSSMVYI